jgi:hypothetical protein
VNVVVANRVVKQYSKDGNAAVEKLIAAAVEVLTT